MKNIILGLLLGCISTVAAGSSPAAEMVGSMLDPLVEDGCGPEFELGAISDDLVAVGRALSTEVEKASVRKRRLAGEVGQSIHKLMTLIEALSAIDKRLIELQENSESKVFRAKCLRASKSVGIVRRRVMEVQLEYKSLPLPIPLSPSHTDSLRRSPAGCDNSWA